MTSRDPGANLWRAGAFRDPADAMARYRPEESTVPAPEWAVVRPLALAYVSATRPRYATSAVLRLRITAQFLVWGHARSSVLVGFILGALNMTIAGDWYGRDWTDLVDATEAPPKLARRVTAKVAKHRQVRSGAPPG